MNSWAFRLIARAAPTCTLWRLDHYWYGFVFRLWPRWRLARKLIAENQ